MTDVKFTVPDAGAILSVWKELHHDSDENLWRLTVDAEFARAGLFVSDTKCPGVIFEFPAVTRSAADRFNAKFRNIYRNLDVRAVVGHAKKTLYLIQVTRRELLEDFAVFCAEALKAFAEDLPHDGSSFVRRQLDNWETLFKRTAKPFTPEVERGLFGELSVLKDSLTHLSPAQAMEAWAGPDDAPQDFNFGTSALEVKTLYKTVDRVCISSLEQLSCGVPLTLTVVFLSTESDAAAANSSALTLREAVEQIDKLLASDPDTLAEFDRKLCKVGFNRHLGITGSDLKYTIRDKRCFNASAEKFPSLTRDTLNPAIIGARYELALSGIEEFEIEKKND